MNLYQYKCELVRVVDGDTVDVDVDLGFGVWLRDERVRLADIDTPEVRTRDLTEKAFGLAASARVTELLTEADELILLSEAFKGKFGRILGDFLINGEGNPTLCETLLTEHWAVPYSDSDEVQAAAHLANRTILLAEGKVVLPQ